MGRFLKIFILFMLLPFNVNSQTNILVETIYMDSIDSLNHVYPIDTELLKLNFSNTINRERVKKNLTPIKLDTTITIPFVKPKNVKRYGYISSYIIPPLTYFHNINRYELLSQKILFTINRNKKNQILLSKEYFKRMGIDINMDYDRHIILIQMILVD